MSLPLRDIKHVTNDVKFPPVAPESYRVKPFYFRPSLSDQCYRKSIYEVKGSGRFGYLEVIKLRVILFKTDNYFLALSKNLRFMDFNPPIKNHQGMDVYEYTKYKLLRSLENFVHFMTHQLPTKSDYTLRLSLSIRAFAVNFKFTAIARALKPLKLRGKMSTSVKPIYPYPTVVGLDGDLPKARQVSDRDFVSSELSSLSSSGSRKRDDSSSLSDD